MPCSRRHFASAVLAGPLLLVSAGSLSADDLYAPRSDWSSFTGSKLNISAFIYRDSNRNGLYDLPDRPMENVAVTMIAPDGHSIIRWSNSNGFANFTMSAKKEEADITQPGDYLFKINVPPDWAPMGGPLTQVKHFEIFPGSVADMVATPPFVAVGLAQTQTIEGIAPEGALISAVSPAGEAVEVTLDADRRFQLPVFRGKWELVAESAAGPVHRTVEVTDGPPVLLSAALLGPLPEPLAAPTRLVDFEDVTEKDLREMPNGVGGVNWWNFVALKLTRGYQNNSVSGDYVAYNSSGHPARISSAVPFDFVGGHFGVAWQKANGEELIIEGWRNNEKKYEDRIVLSNLGPVWFEAEYRGIDRLDFRTAHYWQLVADDLVFRAGP